jgi:hypothetical protein
VKICIVVEQLMHRFLLPDNQYSSPSTLAVSANRHLLLHELMLHRDGVYDLNQNIRVYEDYKG